MGRQIYPTSWSPALGSAHVLRLDFDAMRLILQSRHAKTAVANGIEAGATLADGFVMKVPIRQRYTDR